MANNHPPTLTKMPEQDKIKLTPAPARPLQQPDESEPQVKPDSRPWP
jgi:hypothetical protein